MRMRGSGRCDKYETGMNEKILRMILVSLLAITADEVLNINENPFRDDICYRVPSRSTPALFTRYNVQSSIREIRTLTN